MAFPSVSRWASVRLPSLRRFRKPPYDPGRRDFPGPVLTLAFLRGPSQSRGEAQALTYVHPACAGLPTSSSLLFQQPCPGSVSGGHLGTAKCPEPLCCTTGVTFVQETSSVSSRDVTPTSSLLRTHAPNRCPPAAFDIVSCGQVFAGCCQPLLRSGPSRRYLCRSLLACLDPYSGGSQGARARYFPRDIGLPLLGTGSAHSRCSRQLLLSGEKSRSCSHSPTFRPTSLLATQVAPTLASRDAGRPWLLRPRISQFVTSPCSGYAYRPNPGN